MAVNGDIIAKSKEGVFIAHEISDVVTVDDPVGVFSDPKTFRVDEFVEETYRDADSYFFSLGDDASGFAPADAWDSPSLSAAISLNLVADENGIFIGPSTTNLWPDQTELHGFIGDGEINRIYSTPAGVNKCVELIKTSSVDEFSSLGLDNITTYTGIGSYSISAYVRNSGGSPPATLPNNFILAQGTGGAAITNTLIANQPETAIISTQWNRFIRSADYTGSSVDMTPYIKWNDISTSDAEYRLYGFQLEKRPFPTPYVEESRAAAQLAFNLNADIGLDWSTPWTILYWKKAIGTDNDLIGYSVESLGQNGNSVGGGYSWWGKVNNSYDLLLSSGTVESGLSAFDWNDYQYEWHLIVLRYDGSETKLNIYGVNEDPIISTRAEVIPSSNYYVNQNGYDLQLGGYDLSHQPAAYYRGLTIYKRELTDEYVTKYYNTKLKIFNIADELTIYSGIILEEDL